MRLSIIAWVPFTTTIRRSDHEHHTTALKSISGSNAPNAATESSTDDHHDPAAKTVYRLFAEHAWERLESLEYLQEAVVDSKLLQNQSPKAKDGSSVHVSVRALTGTSQQAPIRYARYALLETIPAHTNSIQVLNMVIFPNSPLPVWGADFVSLPGNKHLLLLDAQPMSGARDYADRWEEWFQTHVDPDTFPWGGDLPEKVQPFVSKHALWSRLGSDDGSSPDVIQKKLHVQLYKAYTEHLDHYLKLLTSEDRAIGDHQQHDYISYRLENDPARPMLKRLFGEEWTENVLEKVLFPK